MAAEPTRTIWAWIPDSQDEALVQNSKGLRDHCRQAQRRRCSCPPAALRRPPMQTASRRASLALAHCAVCQTVSHRDADHAWQLVLVPARSMLNRRAAGPMAAAQLPPSGRAQSSSRAPTSEHLGGLEGAPLLGVLPLGVPGRNAQVAPLIQRVQLGLRTGGGQGNAAGVDWVLLPVFEATNGWHSAVPAGSPACRCWQQSRSRAAAGARECASAAAPFGPRSGAM